MNSNGLVIGGIIPAVCLGLGTLFVRASLGAGASIPTYLAIVGTTIGVMGWSSMAVTGHTAGLGATPAVGWAACMGIAWSLAIACIFYAMGTLKIPVSIIAPFTNSNCIVALAGGAVVFGEWQHVNGPRALLGTLLVVAGASVVAIAK
jgi:transporter family protein